MLCFYLQASAHAVVILASPSLFFLPVSSFKGEFFETQSCLSMPLLISIILSLL